MTRTYTSRRANIVEAISEKLKEINGSGAYLSDVENNVHPFLRFWDEVQEFPAIHLNAGSETREYQGGGYKDRFLSVTVRCYVNEEDAQSALNALMEDVETVLEESSQIQYSDRMNNIFNVQQITIISIDTDEGVLEPLGVGEILIEVRY
ncbi:hypothetical protein N8862_03595 [Pseudomonadales bacterium]|jgi:hypothetical protein|nr:hypothetical protein [Pseudomonadales bacterium]|tara:strand:+ start:965 stop:1414 length:450 start_codon:yes stop_codon:yes gene_type:complete